MILRLRRNDWGRLEKTNGSGAEVFYEIRVSGVRIIDTSAMAKKITVILKSKHISVYFLYFIFKCHIINQSKTVEFPSAENFSSFIYLSVVCQGMDAEFHLKRLFVIIEDNVIDEKSLATLKSALFPEDREELKKSTFLQIVSRLRNCNPQNYLEQLKDALLIINREDVVREIDSISRIECEQECNYDEERDELVPSGLTFDDLLEIDNNFKRTFYGVRDYQDELAQPALNNQNSIICSPTGSGKTIIAGYICKVFVERNPKIKIVFLVPVRSLAKQQSKMLSEFLNSAVLSNPNMDLREIFTQSRAVVLTPQLLVNELEQNKIQLEDLDLIVFDECHHTKLDHPYNRLMKIYHLKRMSDANHKLPQILGLTASLGTDNSSNEEQILEHFANLCARLDSLLKTVQDPDNKLELLKFNSMPSKDQIITCKHRKDQHFYLEINNLMSEIERVNNIPSLPIRGSLGCRSEIVKQQSFYESQEGTLKEILACMALNILNEALLLYKDSTEIYVVKFVKKEFLLLIENETWMKLQNMVMICMERLNATYNLKDSWRSNQKLVELYDLVVEISEQKATCVLIAKTCRNVDFLYELFTNQSDLNEKLYILKVVGRKNAEYGMRESQQVETISNFKRVSGQKGALLIATDVIQEGFDLPKCNAVIRYNHVSNEIGTIQARGRARAPDSKIYLIVDEDSVDIKREYENLFRERKMLEVMDSLSEKQQYFQDLVDKAKVCLREDLKLEIMRRNELIKYNAENVEIYCKLCKVKICSGDSIKKCPAGHITMEPLVDEVSHFEPWDEIRSFKTDDRLGDMKCKSCSAKLAIKIRLKKSGSIAYVLVKNYLSWKLTTSSRYRNMPKNWSELEFQVEILDG